MALSLCRPSRAAARRLAALGPKDPANLAWRSASQAQKGEQLPQAAGVEAAQRLEELRPQDAAMAARAPARPGACAAPLVDAAWKHAASKLRDYSTRDMANIL
ncbi:unnamed protein product [Effrenium voratum]|nr:unnamed protein product [Effrenium voratum]